MEHLKLPHYVTFGSSLQGTLAMQAEKNSLAHDTGGGAAEPRASHGAAEGRRRRARAEGLEASDDHHGIAAGQLHHHGDGVLHAHDD